MTVVNPKSISGINSITMASGSDNLLTIHTTNTTERIRVNSDGDVIVGSGITVSPDGDIFATGVTTSTTFSGNFSGGTVSGTTGTFSDDVTVTGSNKKLISNSTSSGDYVRVYAAGGTGKWDIYGNGADLRFSDNDSAGVVRFDTDVSIADKIIHTGDTNTSIRFPADDTIQFETGGTNRLRIDSSGNIGAGTLDTTIDEALSVERAGNVTIMAECTATGSGANAALRLKSADSSSDWYIQTGNSVSGKLRFYGGAERMTLGTDGHLSINDGNLVIGTSGHGIDFSATGDASGMTSELLDDYEEGTWTPGIGGSSGSVTSYYNQEGKYTKIGRLVKCHFRVRVNDAGNAAGNMEITNLPYTVADTLPSTGLDGSGGPTYWASQSAAIVNMTMTPQGNNTKAWIYIATGATTTMSNLTNSNAFGGGWDVRAELMYFAA